MYQVARELRTPEERVGMLPNASLPPPTAVERSSTTEDALLLQALRDRDDHAFARVLDLYYAPMLRLAMTHVDTQATAEEVVQETWLAAMSGIDRFEGRAAVKTWLFRILRNLARTRGKRDIRMRPFSELERDDAHRASGRVDGPGSESSLAGEHAMWARPEDAESQLLSSELRAHLERAMATLPPRQREVIVLRDVEGWTAEEVCNAMGITQTNQRVMLHRARDRVRDEIRWYLDQNDGCGDDE